MPSAKQHASRRSIRGRVTLLAIAVAGLASTAHAQSLAFAQFDGNVRDGALTAIHEAEVRIEDRASGAVRWAVTARDGSFRFAVLPAGRYDVTVEALGYRPAVYLDVRIGVGHTAQLNAILQPAPPPVSTIDTIPRQGDALSTGNWLIERGYGDLVGERRIGADLTAFSTTADAHSVEGLPWRLAESLVDGARAAGFGAPSGSGADAAGLALPVRALSTARVGGLGYDVEVGGTGIGLRATTHRGGNEPSFRPIAEGGSANLGGGLVVAGPLQRDTAQLIVGGDYQRSERDYPLTDSGEPRRTGDRVGMFGRLDWQPSDRLAVTARASGSRLTSVGYGERAGLASLYGSSYEALGAQASLNVFARLSRRIAHEWRISADIGAITGDRGDFPRAAVTSSGFQAGPLLGEAFEDHRTTPRVSGMLHFDLGAHRLKLGFATAAHRFDARFARDTDGDFAIDSPLSAPGRAWRRTESVGYVGEFGMRETALFLQDAWRVSDGLSLILGARIDNTSIPAGKIESNAEWLGLTGLDNSAVRAKRSNVSPRVGLRWELGDRRQWVIEGGAGTYRDLPDRRDIAEALTLDRAADVRYGFGALPFPAEPSLTDAPVVGRTLTMLAPDFAAPRTQRLSLGLTHRAGSWSTSISGVYRNTDFLTRRRDLNLPAASVGSDQFGRPLYGSLQKAQTLVGVTAQSNRRFAQFDAVHALESTGFSEFWGVTGGVEYVQELGLSFAAHYTYSRTDDNIVDYVGARLSPFPDRLDGVDWVDGRSDLDVPHRAVVAADWRFNPVLSLGLVYRLQSGAPYTPMVAAGVDANADGDWHNDPAFVDPALSGMTALIDANDCLRDHSGSFVERNACREDLVHRLDLRATVRLGQLRFGRLELVVDALDVVAPNYGPVDRALLLVDRAGTLSTNAGTGVTTVPYAANPNFGKRLYDITPGVFWRVGLRVVR